MALHIGRLAQDANHPMYKAKSAGAMLELLSATGGSVAIIYQYHAGSAAYFAPDAPDAPDFAEAGELKGDDLATARRILYG